MRREQGKKRVKNIIYWVVAVKIQVKFIADYLERLI